jgi:hypothetical protein
VRCRSTIADLATAASSGGTGIWVRSRSWLLRLPMRSFFARRQDRTCCRPESGCANGRRRNPQAPPEISPSSPGTPSSPAVGLPAYGRLPPPPTTPAPSHRPWKTASRFPTALRPRRRRVIDLLCATRQGGTRLESGHLQLRVTRRRFAPTCCPHSIGMPVHFRRNTQWSTNGTCRRSYRG